MCLITGNIIEQNCLYEYGVYNPQPQNTLIPDHLSHPVVINEDQVNKTSHTSKKRKRMK